VNDLPVKSKKIKKVNRYFYYYIIEDKEFVLLEKRTGKDIWNNLYQFPLWESDTELSDEKILQFSFDFLKNENLNINSISGSNKHQLTHQTIYARFVYITMLKLPSNCNGFLKIHKKDILKFAVPRLLEQAVIKTGNR
jgi:A/G-specific adenine glycosylase